MTRQYLLLLFPLWVRLVQVIVRNEEKEIGRGRERESQISNFRNRHGSISHLKRVECAIRTHAHLYELNRNSIQFRENREKLQIN